MIGTESANPHGFARKRALEFISSRLSRQNRNHILVETIGIRFKGRAIVIRTFGTSRRPDARARRARRTNPHARNHVRHHSSFRASREDRRRHHRQGRQRQVHDDLAPARQQVRERARSIEPSRIFRERIAPHRANVARPLRARARLDDAARAIFR